MNPDPNIQCEAYCRDVLAIMEEKVEESTGILVRQSLAADAGWRVLSNRAVFDRPVLACPRCVERHLVENPSPYSKNDGGK